MVSHRFMRYIVAICIISLFCISYLGYKVYHDHVEFENFMSKSLAFEDTLDKGTAYKEGTPTLPSAVTVRNPQPREIPPVKVGVYSEGEIAVTDIQVVGDPVIVPASEMVPQRVQTPDGKNHIVFVPQGHELKTGAMLPEVFFKQPLPPPALESFNRTIRKEDIPAGEDVESYLLKLSYASAYGVSVEEVERMIENEQISTEVIARSIKEVSDYDYPHPYHSYHPNKLETPIGDAASRVSVEVDSLDDKSNPPARSDAPQSPSVQPDTVKPAPSPLSVEEHEEQLTSPGIKAEVNPGVSVYRSERAQQLIDQYGTEEGLRRLREVDPDAARQFEQHPPVSPRPAKRGSSE